VRLSRAWNLLLKRGAQKSRSTLDLVTQICVSSRTVTHGRQERVAPVHLRGQQADVGAQPVQLLRAGEAENQR